MHNGTPSEPPATPSLAQQCSLYLAQLAELIQSLAEMPADGGLPRAGDRPWMLVSVLPAAIGLTPEPCYQATLFHGPTATSHIIISLEQWERCRADPQHCSHDDLNLLQHP